MIFYFTGTGNSLAVAGKLLGAEERLVNMADALREQKYDYKVGAVLKKKLLRKDLHLNYVTDILMPDNYILLYANKAEGCEQRLARADERVKAIATDIAQKKCIEIGRNSIISDIMAVMYEHARKTSGFYAEDACISCGMCERNCPDSVIRMVNGKPVWKKEKCVQCLACINRCPVKAIQYGTRTVRQGRYVHPELKGDV